MNKLIVLNEHSEDQYVLIGNHLYLSRSIVQEELEYYGSLTELYTNDIGVIKYKRSYQDSNYHLSLVFKGRLIRFATMYSSITDSKSLLLEEEGLTQRVFGTSQVDLVVEFKYLFRFRLIESVIVSIEQLDINLLNDQDYLSGMNLSDSPELAILKDSLRQQGSVYKEYDTSYGKMYVYDRLGGIRQRVSQIFIEGLSVVEYLSLVKNKYHIRLTEKPSFFLDLDALKKKGIYLFNNYDSVFTPLVQNNRESFNDLIHINMHQSRYIGTAKDLEITLINSQGEELLNNYKSDSSESAIVNKLCDKTFNLLSSTKTFKSAFTEDIIVLRRGEGNDELLFECVAKREPNPRLQPTDLTVNKENYKAYKLRESMYFIPDEEFLLVIATNKDYLINARNLANTKNKVESIIFETGDLKLLADFSSVAEFIVSNGIDDNKYEYVRKLITVAK